MALPLAGQLVIALEQAVAAPYCTARLADAGARVIKIERAEGDFARGYDHAANGESSYFVWVNRGKESICLDIKADADKTLLLNMLVEADVFVQNLAPGAAQRAGLGARELRSRNQRLITLDISGYGAAGEYSDMKAYDLLVQCESGLVSVTGSPAAPGRVGISVCDIACGMASHAAILEALIERTQTGVGKSIHVSLFDAVAEWMTVPLLHQEHSGEPPPRVGVSHPSIAPYGAFNSQDGAQVVIAVQNGREWTSLCKHVLKNDELAESERYKTNVSRCANRASLDAAIQEVFSTLSRVEIRDRLRDAGVAFANLNDLRALSDHPQLRRTTVQIPTGTIDLVAPSALCEGGPEPLGPVPALGEHSDAIRKEFAE